MSVPYIIDFARLGRPEIGYLSVAEQNKNIPFDIKRTFWAYFTPESIVRGRHAHYETEMVLIAVSGRITLFTEMLDGKRETFVLDSPDRGVYIPPYCWHTMQYSHTATQLVISSSLYEAEDYIRSYEDFENLKKELEESVKCKE